MFIFVAAAAVCITVAVGAAIDAARLPRDAWERTDKSRTAWIVLPAVFSVGIIGLVLAVIYFTSIRPQVLGAVDAPDLGGTTGPTF